MNGGSKIKNHNNQYRNNVIKYTLKMVFLVLYIKW